MFFRRKKPQENTFSQHLSALREAGFDVQPVGEEHSIATRDGFAALLKESETGDPVIEQAGFVLSQKIAALTSRGFQTVWRSDSGAERAATAEQLSAYHAFLEDLRGLLGLESLYNQSLGTTHTTHHYDRLAGRA